MNEIFRFKNFSVEQNPEVFKVGTDGVLAGCLAGLLKAKTVLDIGTGTGLLSLITAQRNPDAFITAIDSEKEACSLAEENVKNSPFSRNILVIHSDLKHFISDQKFDYIICNPPYFKISEQQRRKLPAARSWIKLDYTHLLKKSRELLSDYGSAGYIFPYEQEEEFISLADTFNLLPKRIVRISGIKNGKIRRTFLELTRQKQKTTSEKLYIEESPRIWSEEYRNLTREFYL